MTISASHPAVSASAQPAARHAVRRDGRPLIVGTRGSALAMWQTTWVLERLHERVPSARWTVEEVRTRGDRTQALDIPLTQLGDKSMFVAELEHALLSGALDAAVHSLKDLPGRLTYGLALAAVPEREDPRDALVSRSGATLRELPTGATVATGSLRRRAQLLALRPDLRIVSIRGNVDTRLRKALADDGPDATVLAVAGLRRLGLERHITEYLPVDVLVPAVGQGALAVEVRADHSNTRRLLRQIDHLPTRRAVLAERAVLATVGGGCQVPLGAHATVSADGQTLLLRAVVASLDGRHVVRIEREGPATRPVTLGRAVAHELLRTGAGAILHDILRAGAGGKVGSADGE